MRILRLRGAGVGAGPHRRYGEPAARQPLCGVSLALVEHNLPVLGVIDLPLLDLRYYGARGGGAFGNDRELRPPSHSSCGKPS
jgi:fructose-1,6-bisphosphatase/inositol monophosphatase family enzyme